MAVIRSAMAVSCVADDPFLDNVRVERNDAVRPWNLRCLHFLIQGPLLVE